MKRRPRVLTLVGVVSILPMHQDGCAIISMSDVSAPPPPAGVLPFGRHPPERTQVSGAPYSGRRALMAALSVPSSR